MEKKKYLVFKIIMSTFFALAIIGAMVYRLWKGEPWDSPYLYFASIGACLLLCVLFLKSNAKGILIALSLGAIVGAEYFTIFKPFDAYKDVSLYVLCGSQLFLLIYTFSITKSNALRAINLGLRVGISLSIYLVLTRYFILSTYQIVYLIYFANSFITFVCLLFNIKKQWLAMLGMLFITLSIAYIGLLNEGFADVFGITGEFVNFLTNYEYLVVYYYVFGLLLISMSSVWAVRKEE